MLIKDTTLRALLPGVWMGLAAAGAAAAAEGPDALYRQGRYAEAEAAYAQADMDRPRDVRYRYNRGCAAYRKGDYQGARAAFSSVLSRAEKGAVRFKAAYNLGNAAYRSGDLQAAVQAYVEALRLDPDSQDARYNLELALKAQAEQEKKKDPGRKGNPGEAGSPQEPEGGRRPGNAEPDKKGTPSPQRGVDEGASPEESAERAAGQAGSPEQTDTKRPGENGAGEEQAAGAAGPRDLSGELHARNEVPQAEEEKGEASAAASLMDGKKAEALLDNIREDPARLMRLRAAQSGRGRVPSGKDW